MTAIPEQGVEECLDSHMHIVTVAGHVCFRSNVTSSRGCFDELGAIWGDWAISASFGFKEAAEGAAPRAFLPRTSGCSVLPALKHNAPLLSLRGPDTLQTHWALF